ncbi:hypothetical protein [Nocardia puris]|uniref:hypothetical protein n=1 Tax=Nocardia puris TaxID=208602 RepID=UPI002E250B42
MLRFIDALVAAGATTVVRPGCPHCGLVRALDQTVDGLRVCGLCMNKSRIAECGQCGDPGKLNYRNDAGVLVCNRCRYADPVSRDKCIRCGRWRIVNVRTGEGPLCGTCVPRADQECSICGAVRRCEMSRATGRPWCERCQGSYCRCSSCGLIAPLRGGTTAAPLCARCVNPDPEFWGRCPGCRTTWQFGRRLCQRCAVDRKLCTLLGSTPTGLPGTFVPLRDALVAVDRPDHARGWLAKPEVRRLLTAIGSAQHPLTHELLDELGGGKALDYLRAVLVSSGVLPDRDETLSRLERWVDTALAQRDNLDERRILHGYAVWHHLRRLRARVKDRPATVLQEWHVRTRVTGAVQLLDFLGERGKTLAGCAQAEWDDFLANVATYPEDSAAFVRWAVKNKHASGLEAPARRWVGPAGPRDEQARWQTARRLMHDDGLTLGQRVAGLLLVLCAQHPSTITRLTVDHVDHRNDRVTLRLGTVPITLPPPLDALMVELIDTRRGNTLLHTPGRGCFPDGTW